MTTYANSRRSVSGGFTLVELLIVIVILSILLATLSLRFTNFTGSFHDANLDANLTQLREAIQRYRSEHGHYPGAKDAKGANCPNGGKAGKGKGAGGAKKSFAEQLTMYTNRFGQACSTSNSEFRYGPYIRSARPGEEGLPSNPITSRNAVNVVHDGDLNLTSDSNEGGWKYDRFSGKIIVDHEDYDDL